MKLKLTRLAYELSRWPVAAYCAAPLLFLAGGGGSNFVTSASAACVSGAQCEANGFAESPAANDSFNAIGTDPENAALKAINGGSITGSGLTIKATTGFTPYGAYVDSNGEITLTDPATTITGFRGVRAQGGGSFTMTDGKIDTGDVAVEVFGDGTVTLKDVDIERSSGSATAVRVGTSASNASFTMTGGSIDSVLGAITVSGADSQATLSGVTIKSVSAMQLAGSNQNTTLTLNGGTTLTHSSATAAIQSGRGTLFLDDAHITATNGPGITVLTSAGLANVDAKNFSVTLTGTGSGRGIQLGVNSVVKLEKGSITTQGVGARGIDASSNQNNALVADDMKITTHGDDAHAMFASRSTTTLTNSQVEVNGDNTVGVFADSLNLAGAQPVINMTGGSILATGDRGQGARAARGGEVNLDGVTITTTHANSFGMTARFNATATFKNGTMNSQGHGVRTQNNSVVDVDNSVITSAGAGSYGVSADFQSTVTIGNGSVITAAGANGAGLGFISTTENNIITLDASTVAATGTNASSVTASGGDNQLHASNSSLSGDRLVVVRERIDGGNTYDAKLDFNAANSILTGHAAVAAASTLRMNLTNNTDWTLRPSSSGMLRSDVTFLNLDGSRVIFDPASAQRQTLVVGSGDASASPVVYQAFANARIEMNTVLNAGGALADQSTDRLLINGDVSGTTLLSVNPVAGSVGAATSPSNDNLAHEGISLVQVSGNAAANAFVLDGTYVTVGGQPWRYSLHAYGPGSANGLADGSQRLVDGANPHWDWRLQSEFMDTFGGFKPVPQIANYLTAPTALFQSGLLDVAMLHRRLGDTRQMGTRPTDARNHREFFLRTYGGDYDYRSNRPTNAYGYGADIRYTAAQIGGTVHAGQSERSSTRIGLAANYGQLRFAPLDEPDTRKTRMDTWSVSPTLNWQHEASGAYVDAMLAWSQFRADVATTLRSKAATLKGTRQTVSVETGLPLIVGTVTAIPQAQVVYQRLDFDRVRDVDGFDVSLGTPKQWTFKAGMEVRTTRVTAAGSAIRLYGKTHFVQHLNRHRQVWLGEAFALGKSGTLLENGAGVDAVLAKGQVTLFADLTRQHRVSRRAGSQGWSANMGMKLRF